MFIFVPAGTHAQIYSTICQDVQRDRLVGQVYWVPKGDRTDKGTDPDGRGAGCQHTYFCPGWQHIARCRDVDRSVVIGHVDAIQR